MLIASNPAYGMKCVTAGEIRPPYKNFVSIIENLPPVEMTHKDEMAKKLFMSQGITFTVYSSGEGIEKIFPFDIIPRIITSDEWALIEAGIKAAVKSAQYFSERYLPQAIYFE